jgi:transposase
MWRPSILTRAQLEERRLEGGRLLVEGQLTRAEIARRLGISRRTVCAWSKQLKDSPEGLKALKSRPRSGRPSRLSDEQWRRLLESLERGALEAGFQTDRWTLDRIRTVIRRLFGVTYHAHYLGDRLRALGWSPQIPAVVAVERDEELVLAWLAQDWPRIKKKLAAKGPRSCSGTRPASHSARASG